MRTLALRPWRGGLQVKAPVVAAILTAAFAVFPVAASAATLFFSPAGGSYGRDSSFTVGIYVSSADLAMNAVSGTISFPEDRLEVVNLSKSGSVISLWVRDPDYSNTNGTISFEGIVLNPGFTGKSGKMLAVTFRAKQAGTAPVSVGSASILANDGLGTEIFKGAGTGTYTVTESVPVVPAPEKTVALAAPQVVSSTHPEPSTWYAAPTADFSWDVPGGATRVRTSITASAQSVPTVEHPSSVDQREVTGLKDGTWYFHAQFGNDSGWGKIAHYRLNIDTAPPHDVTASVGPRPNETVANISVNVSAADDLSGIAGYEFSIDGAPSVHWQDDGSHVFVSSALEPGRHELTVTAVDAAGNKATTAPFAVNVTAATAPEGAAGETPQGTAGLPARQASASWTDAAINEAGQAGMKTAFFSGILFTLLVLLAAAQVRRLMSTNSGKTAAAKMRRKDMTLHRAFDLLREEVRTRLKPIESAKGKKGIVQEEEKAMAELKRDLDEVEAYLLKMINDLKDGGK